MTQYKKLVETNLHDLRERILKASQRAGRKEEEISIMAITKTHPWEAVEAAYSLGLRLFGENKVKEAAEKYTNKPEDLSLHLVGHLQRNKAKTAVEVFSAVQSIDKAETAYALEKFLLPKKGSIDILLEVNTSDEETKAGCRTKEELFSLIEDISNCRSLIIKGLMTLGPVTDEEALTRNSFRSLYKLFEEIKRRYPELPLEVLSMGMTSDYALAIEEGSNLIRIGTALFGPRQKV